MKTNKETRRSIPRKPLLLKIFSKLYLEAATKRCSLKLVFLKCWQQKQLYSGITSFKEHLLLATTPYNKGFFLLNVTCCSRLWASSFIYFKSTRVFFYLMFLMDVLLQLKKEICKAMCVLWFDVFNELSSSIKEINGLIWKGMSNIYHWGKLFSKLRFSRKEN